MADTAAALISLPARGGEVIPFPARDARVIPVEALAARYREWHSHGPRFEPDPFESMDAAYECAHGKLPHDRVQTCACHGAGQPVAPLSLELVA